MLSDYEIETLEWQRDFMRERIFRAAMRTVRDCPECSTLRPCNVPLHQLAKDELRAWAQREWMEKFSLQFTFKPEDEPIERIRYGARVFGVRTLQHLFTATS